MFPNTLSHSLMIDITVWILILFLILALTVMIYKAWQHANLKSNNRLFLEDFWASRNLTEARQVTVRHDGPLPRIAKAGFAFLESLSNQRDKSLRSLGEPGELLESNLKVEVLREMGPMERALVLLAVIAITSPFIGLLGTVLSIQIALHDISKSGAENLAVVTGPISAALIATAIGIAVAMPTALAYYFFLRRISINRKVLEDFAADFLRLSRDNRFKNVQLPVPPPQDTSQPAEAAAPEEHSYGQILKSSALIGGSSVINVAIGIIRTKVMAVLLGPSGVGLMGLYSSITDLAQSIAGMGINSSGVRQIAEAVGSGDTEKIARTVVVLRRTSIFLGIFGAVLLITFSKQASTLTFGNDQHVGAVALLAVVVFLRCISDGQGALIQGMRRIADMSKMSILGALFGAIITIPLVYYLREEGIVPSIIGIAAMAMLTSWWYSRKVKIRPPSMAPSDIRQEVAELMKLGFVFMSSSMMMVGASYVIRVILVRTVGLEAAGLYQSAWTLGGLYIGFILQAMGADFYPRLTAVAKDNLACNRMVNEQAHISLLLAGPGVIATLTLAPLVISLFYSSKFDAAAEILRWICLGMTLRVVSWPMGFIIVAKGERSLFFWAEAAWTVVYLGLVWLCVAAFQTDGAGIAFFISYIFHVFMIYFITRRLSGFHWSDSNRQTGLLFLALIAMVFSGFYVLSPWLAIGVGILATFLSGIYSIRVLLNLVALDRIPRFSLRILEWLRFVAADSKT